jgi:lipoprotein
MKQRSGLASTIAIIAAAAMMSSCSEESAPNSTESPSPPISTSATPHPSANFNTEQLEATDTLIKYYRVRDEVYSSIDADPQPLKDITTGEMQTLQLDVLESNREIGIVLKGFTVVHLLGASTPEDVNGVRSVTVQVCVDNGNIDAIDSNTGESGLVVGRIQYTKESTNVVRTNEGWKVGDGVSEEIVSECPN